MDVMLPPEIIIKIFQNLSHRNLKNVVLVSRNWKVMAEDPSLWTWCQVTIQSRIDLKKLNIRRLQWIENINLADIQPHFLDVLLRRVESLPKMKRISGLSFKNLECVEPDLLGKIVNKLECAEWCFLTNITSEQAEAAFRYMAERTKLLELKILNIDQKLMNINPDVMASALNKLELLWMSDSVTANQMSSIFNRMSIETKLNSLCLRDVNMTTTEPIVLAKALNRLTTFLFQRPTNKPSTDLTAHQAQAIFTIMSKGSQLKMLEISTEQLPSINPSCLAKAINQLEDVSLLNSEITSEQALAIFAEMSEKTQLKSLLNLRHNLSMIHPRVFGKGLSKLEEVSIRNCQLTKEQVIALFLAISTGGQLLNLDISFNNLSSVEPYFLARGVNMLEQVTLTRTSLTADQINAIFRVFLEEETKLEILSVESIDIQKADPALVIQAKKKFAEGNF